jgi:hypothetical protein
VQNPSRSLPTPRQIARITELLSKFEALCKTRLDRIFHWKLCPLFVDAGEVDGRARLPIRNRKSLAAAWDPIGSLKDGKMDAAMDTGATIWSCITEFTIALLWVAFAVLVVQVALFLLENSIKLFYQCSRLLMGRTPPVAADDVPDDVTLTETEGRDNNYAVVLFSPEAILDSRLAPLLRRTWVGGGLIKDGGELAFDMATALERMAEMIMQPDAGVDEYNENSIFHDTL